MTPVEIWPMIAASGIVVFGAGRLFEKVRNGKYVQKIVCTEHLKLEQERWEYVKECLKKMENWMEEIRKG